MGCDNIQNNPSVPNVALSATSNQITIENSHRVSLSKPTTLRRGSLLGIVRPTWIKITESEQRLAWLQSMVRKRLIVRDIESYAKSVSTKLRSEELKYREEERDILLGLMNLKVKDEKLNLRNLNKKKEEEKRKIVREVGNTRQYNTLLRTRTTW